MLSCVYVDLEGVLGSEPDALAERALEACRRAEVLVVPVSRQDLDAVEPVLRELGLTDCVYADGFVIDGEEHPGGLAAHARARALTADECLTVSAFERDEVGPAWVTTAGGAGLYEAVVTTLMERW